MAAVAAITRFLIFMTVLLDRLGRAVWLGSTVEVKVADEVTRSPEDLIRSLFRREQRGRTRARPRPRSPLHGLRRCLTQPAAGTEMSFGDTRGAA